MITNKFRTIVVLPSMVFLFSLLGFVGIVLAAAPTYNIDIDTPVSISGADVSLTGTASSTKFAGQIG